MTTIIQALTTLGDKFTTEQLKALEEGLISFTIREGCRHYPKNTPLMFGENNANSKGEFIDKIDVEDKCVSVCDGDGDTHNFNWVNKSGFISINLVVEESYFEEQEKFKAALEIGSPNTLLELTLTEKANRDELEQQIKDLNAKLSISNVKIDKLDTKVKEIFKL